MEGPCYVVGMMTIRLLGCVALGLTGAVTDWALDIATMATPTIRLLGCTALGLIVCTAGVEYLAGTLLTKNL